MTILRQSLTTLSELGARQDVARLHTELSRSLFALGDDTEAARGWRAALHIAGETSGTFIALEALVGLAALHAKHGDPERALALLLLVLPHPATIQATQQHAEQIQQVVVAQLTPEQIATVQARVQSTTFETVINEWITTRSRVHAIAGSGRPSRPDP